MRDALAAALLLAFACGCAAPKSRRFAVTLLDATEMDCFGETRSSFYTQREVDNFARDIRRAWERERESEPPLPEGRLLRVNEIDIRMRAWFDPYTTPSDLYSPRRYAEPTTVYQGDVHSDYIEGSYQEVFNTDRSDLQAMLEPCGDRLRAEGELTLTDTGDVLGRIRWTDYLWFPDGESACAATVQCSRNIEVEGLEAE